MTRSRRRALVIATPLALLVAAAAVRAALEPRESPAPVADLSPPARARVRAAAEASREDPARLRARALAADVLLVGEDHYYRETLAWLTALLDGVEGRRVALLLELPASLQPAVDEWVATGRSARMEEAVRDGKALPYGPILSWAHLHPAKVSRVAAMDEDRATVVLHRALLHDTRNETMARAILAARRERPSELVVAYGGQMHMMLGGRYRYDRADRVPAGARLVRAGVPRERILGVMLSGAGGAPVWSAAPEKGALALAGPAGGEAFSYFVEAPVFRAPLGRDLFDYAVNLGPLTRVAGR